MEERFFTSQTFILRISLNSIVTCKFVIANLRVENKNKYYNDLLAWSIIKQHDDRKLQTTNDEVKRNVFWISKASLKKKTWSMHHWLEACSESNGGTGGRGWIEAKCCGLWLRKRVDAFEMTLQRWFVSRWSTVCYASSSRLLGRVSSARLLPRSVRNSSNLLPRSVTKSLRFWIASCSSRFSNKRRCESGSRSANCSLGGLESRGRRRRSDVGIRWRVLAFMIPRCLLLFLA